MQYKGEDLDLRVPGSRAARETIGPDIEVAAGRWTRASYVTGTGEPIWVDEIVLQCCNYAFDVALSHAASEVGVEHLIHALTRVDAAARILESRGVREGQLRRESAALIASEIPANPGSERSAPRRSPDLEDVLRRATELGARRGLAASVDDIVWTVLHYGRDLPAVSLLRRLTPDWQRADWGRLLAPRAEVLAPEPRMVEQPRIVHTIAYDAVLPRIGSIEDGMRAMHADLTSDRKSLAELIRDIQRDVVAQRTDQAAFRGDIGQRLETLERNVQARGDQGRAAAHVIERVQALEKAVHNGLGEGARNWAALGQRLQSLETVLSDIGSGSELNAVVSRINALETTHENRARDIARSAESVTERLHSIERVISSTSGEGGRHWTSLSERIGTIETLLKNRPVETARIDIDPLLERLSNLERSVRSGFGETAQHAAELSERVVAAERAANDQPQRLVPALTSVAERIAAIERAIEVRLYDASSLSAEMAGFSNEIAGQVKSIEQRLATVPAASASTAGQPVDLTVLTGPLGAEMVALRNHIGERHGHLTSTVAQLADHLTTLIGEVHERSGLLAKEGSERALLISKETTDRVSSFSSQVAERLAVIETGMRANAEVAEAAMLSRDREIAEMQEAIVRLADNQQALASAIADWRHEAHVDLGNINTEISRLTTSLLQPAHQHQPKPAAAGPLDLNTRVTEVIPAAGAAGERRDGVLVNGDASSQTKRGFRYWLFGTNSIRHANREAGMRFEQLQKAIRERGERA